MDRRFFLTGLGATAATTACSTDKGGDPVDAGNTPTGIIPFRREGGIIIDISVDGGPPAPFLFSTNSSRTWFTPDYEIHRNPLGSDLRPVPFARLLNVSMQAGNVNLPTISPGILSLPNSRTDRGQRAPLAGILGMDAFGDAVLRIRPGFHTLELLPPGTKPGPSAVSLPLSVKTETVGTKMWRYAVVTVVLDGMPLDLLLDTGVPDMVLLDSSNLDMKNLLSKYARRVDAEVQRDSGVVTTSIVLGKALALGGATIGNPIFRVSQRHAAPTDAAAGGDLVMPQPVAPSRDASPAGHLGLGTLLRYIVTIDLAGARLALEPPPANARISAPCFTTPGLILDKPRHEFFAVAGVIPGTPASQSDIRAGDRIIAVNGTPAQDLAPFDCEHSPHNVLNLAFDDGRQRSLPIVTLLP